MKLNENTKIIGSNVILVPYKEKHVPKYHEWMLSEELRDLTASEQLTLEEEYNMQKSWLIDENNVQRPKGLYEHNASSWEYASGSQECTFIVLDKETNLNSEDEIESMIGDTNFFFTRPDGKLMAEAEIMIADASRRGKKRGWEAMLQMILYGIVFIQVEQFVVKIGESNSSSINMFKKMGFSQIKPVDIFNEITMEKNVDSEWVDWIKSQLPIHEILNYENEVRQ